MASRSLTLILPLTALLLATAACEEEEIFVPLAVCTPILDSLDPAEGSLEGGTDVTLGGLFVASDFGERDIQVLLGGAEAGVTGLFRGPGCDVCDACIVEALRCGECESVCRGLSDWEHPVTGEVTAASPCEEWVSFTTPAASAAGPAELLLVNSHGSESGLYFDYTEAGD